MVGLGCVQCWVGWRVEERLVSSQPQGVRGWQELVLFRRRLRTQIGCLRMRRWMLALSSACDVVYTKQRQCVWRVVVDRCLLYERSMCSALFSASELLFTGSGSGADTIVGRDVLV